MCDIEMKDIMAFLLVGLPFMVIGLGLAVIPFMAIVRCVVEEYRDIKRLTNK